MSQHIVLSALIVPPGTATSSWMHPDVDPSAPDSIETYVSLARTAERGFFDLFFLADRPGAQHRHLEQWTQTPAYQNSLEPITALSAIAMATEHIGLGATVSTSFYEPFNIARQFASLDWISHGRAAWNVVTTANDDVAQNFGLDKMAPHDERYVLAKEVFDIVTAYWDTWEDDAFVYDKAAARNFDPAKFHLVDHRGKYFTVKGGLNIARSPQGYPVIIQAGASATGKELAAETAEVVFGTGKSLAAAQEFYTDLKGRMAKFGRRADELKVLSGVQVIVGRTEEEARAKQELLQSIIPIEALVTFLSNDLETTLHDLPLDEPIPADRVPASSNNHQIYFQEIVELIGQGHTLREVARRYTRQTTVIVGDVVQVADELQAWVEAGGSDGFMFNVQWLPGGLDDLVELLVPELQRRGLVRTEQTDGTLRDRLGLLRPTNRHVDGRTGAFARAIEGTSA
ncbi:LLM class flavin-dependent oxidoreductase [Microbacterium sp. zg.B48]|uniref:LLM class flavin-dependent oxidoreductase n=1 Tax=Microbacterium sp. zg.B48 TaxID=2969408 RepID=UPI00214AA7CE|nr:LLM class flavin-dependent oxidoreductase [Microbacterium sp. zg.B48]MCR2764262.1 LLM class flavin-dependent oxidoreductase [Microbacterium sp. zg.B48]